MLQLSMWYACCSERYKWFQYAKHIDPVLFHQFSHAHSPSSMSNPDLGATAWTHRSPRLYRHIHIYSLYQFVLAIFVTYCGLFSITEGMTNKIPFGEWHWASTNVLHMQLVGADKVSNLSMVQHDDFVTESSARLARLLPVGTRCLMARTHADTWH